jgi:DNA-binding NtrC family response regulator
LTLQEITTEAEKNHIAQILRLANGNRSKASAILGISRKTLWEKIKNIGLIPD